MIKKLVTYLLCFSMFIYLPSYAEDIDDFEDYEEKVGVCASYGLSNGVGFSMMGWGIALIVAITILAVVLHQSAAGTAHGSSSSSSSSSSPSSSSSGGTSAPNSTNQTFGQIT